MNSQHGSALDSQGRVALGVFISYSREDLDLAKNLVDGLRGQGLKPYWDEDICAGAAFSEEIKGWFKKKRSPESHQFFRSSKK